MMPNAIQPRENSRGGGTDNASCNSDGDLNLLSANRNDHDYKLNAFNDNPDNRWNRENGFAFSVAQLTSFLFRLFSGRVLFLDSARNRFLDRVQSKFCELTVPAAGHSADLLKRHGKSDILFIIQRFCFPKD